ncbi:MAG: hypothetical protein QNJ32_28110 [Xenococcaceae cyanobacterium MO_167.B27]|nr:hypothetical protein [Xenococcaceae cyanobacterium MO_167.B27]
MKKKPLKAVVAIVRYAGLEFEGLRLTDSTYAIGIPQVVDLLERDINGFRPHKNYASQEFKRILGKRFRPHKIATELDNARINVIGIETFGLLMIQLAIKGNQVAQAIAEASVTTTLEMAYDLAFQNEQKLEEYQARQEARVQGKLTRRTLTDAIQDYIKTNADNLSDNYERFIYTNASDRVNKIVFGRNAKKLRESWKCTELRDAMTFEELSYIDSVERLAVRLIDELGYEPLSAVKEAGNRLLIKPIER